MDAISYMDEWEKGEKKEERNKERFTDEQLLKCERLGKRGAGIVKGMKYYYTEEETESIRSEVAWKRLGKVIKKGASPAIRKIDPHVPVRQWGLYREADTEYEER